MSIIMKGIFTQHERGIIYQCVQKLLTKIVMRKEKVIKNKNDIFNSTHSDKRITLFMQLRKAINSSNLDIVFMIIHKHYKQYEMYKIISFYIFLIVYYYILYPVPNRKTIPKFYINDIILDIENINNNHSYIFLFNKYYVKIRQKHKQICFRVYINHK